MEHHLSYGITQCYLHPTQLNLHHLNPSQTGCTLFTFILDLLTSKGWKADFALLLVLYLDALPVRR